MSSKIAYEEFCRNCHKWRQDHAEEKCLFDSTTFRPWIREEWNALSDMKREVLSEQMLRAKSPYYEDAPPGFWAVLVPR
jgi:hypothetical protein